MPESMSGRFAKLWTASTLSALGTGLTIVAAPLYVSARTSNALIVSATTGVAMLPWLLFALPAGVLVDRVDRRRLMVAVDWARAAGWECWPSRSWAAGPASSCSTSCSS
jgi:MFS family permease